MNTKKKLLLLFFGLLLTFLLPNYVQAALGFAPLDTQGQLLYFGGRPAPYTKPTLVAGTCPSGKTCSADGSGSVNGVGAKYKYTNVITINGVQVDAYVTVESIDSAASITNFDFLTPNPGGGKSYLTKAGSGISSQTIPEAAVFAPRITVNGTGGVTFLIEFVNHATNLPVSLKNVYNNSVDIEDVEVVEYGGFSSYELSKINPIPSGNGANCSTPGGTSSVKAYLGSNNQVKFKGGVGVCIGLYLEEFARIQTKFDSISSLRIKMGQESGNGIRYYGAIFVHDAFTSTAGSDKVTAPTVNLLTTTNTKPTISGTIGGTISTSSPTGSPLAGTDTFSVVVNGITYTNTNPTKTEGKLTISGTTWSLQFLTPLTAGNTYEVIATRNSVLVDQTNNELVISPICKKPQMLNSEGTACITPPVNNITLCHSGNGKNYAKVTIPASGLNGHENHQYDVLADANDKCPDEIPVVCTLPEVRDPATNTCITPTPATCPTLEAVSANIPSYALSDNGKKVTICHNTSSVKNPFTINTISINAFDKHLENHGDYFTKTGLCPTDAVPCPPLVCTLPAVLNQAGDACIVPDPPTARDATTTDLVPVPLDGDIGTHRTISSVILTKTKDGLGATATGTTTVAGTPLTIASGATTWRISSGAVPVGTYTITVKDGYNLTGTGTLTVTCPTGKVATATTCIAPLAPEVDVKSTTEGTPVPLTGKPGSSLTISSVTLTKFKDGLGAAVVGSPVTVGSNITSGQTLWTTPTPSAMVQTVGQYTITATDGNGKTGTNVLTVTCPAGKITTAASCIQSTAPTVIDKTVKEKDPIELKGTVGSVALDNSETFTVQVNGKTYSKGDGNLVVNALDWTLNIPSADLTTILAANSPYDVVATRSGTLIGTGKLTVETLNTPTVEKQTTFDTTPVIKGTVGDAALATDEAFSVAVNGKTYTLGIDNNLVVSSKNWTLTILAGSEIPSKAQPYDVTATRAGTVVDTTSGELTIKPCALPKVVNAAGTECIAPVPTVVPQIIETNLTATPVIHGTVGEVALGSTETFAVKIGTTEPQTYDKGHNALVISGTDWTLTVPAAKAIPPGTYNVDAIRNTTAIDKTEKELVINLVCLNNQVEVNGSCASSSTLPTVDLLSTDDRTPTLTGTVGTTDLSAGEAFSVTIEGTGRTYTLGTSPELSVTGTTWSLAVPRPPLTPTTYSITATRSETINDATSNELTISAQCIPPNIEEDGDCIAAVKIPTVNKLVTDINANTIAVTGTVGNVVLADNESFTVKIHNVDHSNVACSVLVEGKTWTCTLTSKPFVVGIFDVDAKRGTELDKTNQELEITGGKCCIGGVTKECPTEISPPDRRAACESAGGTLPTKSQVLPSRPEANTPEFVRNSNGDCEDGGKLSYNTAITNATIKRARIANAITEKGTFSGSLAGKRLIIGDLTAGSYSTLGCESEDYCEGRTITNATLTDAMIDIDPDYIDSTGAVIDENNQGILVINGTTKPTYKNRNDEDKNAVITNGIIVAGTANNAPVRGLVTNGIFVSDIDNLANNPNSVKTKGREADKVTLTNVTIANAAITTDKNGKTVVGCVKSVHPTCSIATISEWKNDSAISGNDAFVYGTVVNAVLKNATLGESNHCFSSGTVGNKGQLNWKEVVK